MTIPMNRKLLYVFLFYQPVDKIRVSELHHVSITCRFNQSVDSSGKSQEAFCWKVRFHYPRLVLNLSIWVILIWIWTY